jgi:hypothetical protein
MYIGRLENFFSTNELPGYLLGSDLAVDSRQFRPAELTVPTNVDKQSTSLPPPISRLAVFKPSEVVEHHTRLEEFGMTRNIDSFHIQGRSFSR